MALVYSVTSPSPTQSGFIGTQSANIVSAAFSPPASSVIVLVIEAAEGFTSAWNTPTVTDSLGSHLAWTIARTQADSTQSFGAVWVAWANCPSAQTNMTVTATIGVTDSSQYVQAGTLMPLVFTGADTTAPIVNVSSGISSTTSASVNMTPIYTGSALLIAATRNQASVTADTAGSGCYLVTSYTFGAAYGLAWFGTNSGPTATSGSTQTVSLTTSDTSNTWQYIAIEVAAPHGTPSVGTGWTVGAVAW